MHKQSTKSRARALLAFGKEAARHRGWPAKPISRYLPAGSSIPSRPVGPTGTKRPWTRAPTLRGFFFSTPGVAPGKVSPSGTDALGEVSRGPRKKIRGKLSGKILEQEVSYIECKKQKASHIESCPLALQLTSNEPSRMIALHHPSLIFPPLANRIATRRDISREMKSRLDKSKLHSAPEFSGEPRGGQDKNQPRLIESYNRENIGVDRARSCSIIEAADYRD